MSYATVTPRDLLAIAPNPARIPLATIQRHFGIGERQASELRALATRAPQVLEQFKPRRNP